MLAGDGRGGGAGNMQSQLPAPQPPQAGEGEDCRACEDVVVQAPAPGHLIRGGIPTEETVTQVLVSK
jgi:transposase